MWFGMAWQGKVHMIEPIVIEVIGEPVGKAAKVKTRWSTHLPDKTATWMDLVRFRAQLVAPDDLITCPVRVDLEIRMSPAKSPQWRRKACIAGHIRPGKKPDIDNVMKGVADALSKVIWKDDAQVVEAHLVKTYSENPGITATITPLPEPTSAAEWKVTGFADSDLL